MPTLPVETEKKTFNVGEVEFKVFRPDGSDPIKGSKDIRLMNFKVSAPGVDERLVRGIKLPHFMYDEQGLAEVEVEYFVGETAKRHLEALEEHLRNRGGHRGEEESQEESQEEGSEEEKSCGQEEDGQKDT